MSLDNGKPADKKTSKKEILHRHASVQVQKATTNLVEKKIQSLAPELASAALVAVEIGSYAKSRLVDGVSRKDAMRIHGYNLGVKSAKAGVSLLTRGICTPLIDMLEARVFEADMDKRNKIRMASTAKMVGMALGLYAGSFVMFPWISSFAAVFIGKNLGELGGRIFVDMTGINGPLDIYNLITACCRSQVESAPSVLPPVVRNLWGFDNDAGNILHPLNQIYRQYEIEITSLKMELEILEKLMTTPETAKELDENIPLEEILAKIDDNIKQLATKRGNLYKETTKFIENNQEKIDNPQRVDLYQHKLRDCLKNDISEPLRKKQLEVKENFAALRNQAPSKEKILRKEM